MRADGADLMHPGDPSVNGGTVPQVPPPRPLRPWWQAALVSTLAGAALSLFGTVPGMGLPGALLAMPAVLLSSLFVAIPDDPFPRDSAWPFFILATLLWGPAVPIAWLGTRAAGLRGNARAAAVILAILALGLLTTTLLYLVTVPPLYG
jgi:hypothetical protein